MFVRLLKLSLFLAVLAFVAWALAEQFRKIDWSTVHLRPLPLLGAVVAMVGVPMVQMISYRRLLGAYAHAPPWRAMAAVAWVPPLGKYVPGKIGALVGAVVMLRKFAVPAAVAVSVVVALDGLAVIAGLITASPLLMWAPVRARLPHVWIGGLIAVVGGLIVLHPKVFTALLNVALRKLKKPPLDHVPDLRHYALPVVCAFAQWLFAGVGLWCATNAVVSVPIDRLPLMISIAAAAMTISYLALFAPGGAGPRELIYSLTLNVLVGPVAAVIAVLMRVVQTGLELVFAGVGWSLLRRVGFIPPRMSRDETVG